MKKFFEEPASLMIIYLFMIIFTFGHAYHSVPDEEKSKFAGVEYTVHNGSGVKATGAFISSIAWPLYWSVQIWRK